MKQSGAGMKRNFQSGALFAPRRMNADQGQANNHGGVF